MDRMAEKFGIILGALAIFYFAAKGLGSYTVSTFVLYLGLTLITRYPKVAIVDTFMLTDCTEFFVYLTALHLGYPLAVAMTFLGLIIPQLIEIRCEGPPATLNRIISTLVSLAIFAFLMKAGVSLLTSIVIGVFISGLIWSFIEFFVIHVTNAAYFAVALAKPIVFYRVLKSIGF